MKLDTRAIRYLTAEDWRVLVAVEMGSKNHEVVPTPLIAQISGLRGGSGVHKSISNLAKINLIGKVKNAKYDGYRLTYGGLDYLALNTHRKSSAIYSVGNQIGVGKESDIYVVASNSGVQRVLKIHRLGRISFRTVKANRDYLRNRSSGSWMYMSRLAALKEYAFMKALKDNNFPVPEPVAQSRHTVVMSLIDAFPLRQISEVPDPAGLHAELLAMIMRLAKYGLIHGDFNEFNILIKEETATEAETNPSATRQADAVATDPSGEPSANADAPSTTDAPHSQINLVPILIDFPQMVSIDHPNAAYYFDRDVACVKRFFERRFHFTSDEPGPFFSDAIKDVGKDGARRLDVEVEASGFSRKMAKELESYMKEVGVDGDGAAADGEGSDEEAEEVSQDATNDSSDRVEGDAREDAHIDAQRSPLAADDDLVGGMQVLDIQDDAAEEHEPAPIPLAPAKAAQSKQRAAKKAAGWAI
ncbi:Atypical/RIO/RIO2 protein kinase [Coniosporium apollinis CBS 100218]|uniref:Serine/threonine-protein kinase RIO2 n=1 Tax=Coniosporium apollinis (strain CBS 100218) TaxID=1168221 RepID=R7YG45_CONA1|nr:Atypical/RIO/RIO2 protein kinase [Coniosporium apollinis CBS 100218]EON60882.1 Atypical/RIO/RIO2 protein kinase [Coniosporium apollinis CBS 100218]